MVAGERVEAVKRATLQELIALQSGDAAPKRRRRKRGPKPKGKPGRKPGRPAKKKVGRPKKAAKAVAAV